MLLGALWWPRGPKQPLSLLMGPALGLPIRRLPWRVPGHFTLLASGECPCTYCKSLWIRASAKCKCYICKCNLLWIVKRWITISALLIQFKNSPGSETRFVVTRWFVVCTTLTGGWASERFTRSIPLGLSLAFCAWRTPPCTQQRNRTCPWCTQAQTILKHTHSNVQQWLLTVPGSRIPAVPMLS